MAITRKALTKIYKDKPLTGGLVYQPQDGMQELLAACPFHDVFCGGARGPGKTYGLCGDFLIHALEYGSAARGLLVRRTYSELEEIERVTTEMYVPCGAVYLRSRRMWLFPNGATLKLRYLRRDAHADNFHGHQYSWLGVDEGGNFPNPSPIDKLRSCLRSPEGIPVYFRMTGNPGGVGHNWLKERYVNRAPALTPFQYNGMWTCYIPGKLKDNKKLMLADPQYEDRIRAYNPPHIVKAWLEGDWNIGAGLFFDDVWDEGRHSLVRPFRIPETWRKTRSFDWGSSKPFSVLWWATSDGTALSNPINFKNGRRVQTFPAGSKFLMREWYGWNGKPNEGLRMTSYAIAQKMLEIETKMRDKFGYEFAPGAADSQIWDTEDGHSIIDDFEASGIYWEKANKAPGTRKRGAALLRAYMDAARHPEYNRPGLYVFDTCTEGWLRTVPCMPFDEDDPEDVATKGEDHAYDATRYELQTDLGQFAVEEFIR